MQQLNGLNGGKVLFFNALGKEVIITMPSGVLGLLGRTFRKSKLNGDTFIEIGDATVLIS